MANRNFTSWLKRLIRPFYYWLQSQNVRLASANFIFKFFFYAFDRNFLSDYSSFAMGADKYERMAEDKAVISLLRRNCHRIEKGVVHPNRRSVFALEFINETIVAFEYIKFHLEHSSTTAWASSVLNCYFSLAQSDDARFVSALNRYNDIVKEGAKHEGLFSGIVYHPMSDPQAANTLGKIINARKSVRRFDEEEIETSAIALALQAALAAPSSCNRQCYRYILTTDQVMAGKIASVSAGTAGWSDQIPNVALVVADYAGFRWAVNRHAPYIDATLSIMPFVLTLEAQGISSCLINWADSPVTRKKIKKLVSLSNSEKVVMTIAFGKAQSEQMVPRSVKKNLEEMCTYV